VCIPDRQCAGSFDGIPNLLQRPLHGLEQPTLDHRQRLLRRGDRDVAGIRAERGFGGQTDGARKPRGTADHQD
jgi:hypothetical protein